MELQSITAELRQAGSRLSKGADALFTLATEKALAEKTYRQALAKEVYRLRQEGMSVSLIGDIARGNVAEEKHQRDLAEARYTAGRELLESLRAEVSALQSVLRYQDDA